MAIKKTIQIGNPILRSKNKKVIDFDNPKLDQLIQDLRDSMNSTGLIGMAAPQIGENFQVFITELKKTKSNSKNHTDQFRIYINPKIVEKSKETVILYEGCGSVLNDQLFGPVRRPKTITIEAFNNQGRKFRLTADGRLGRIIQHEYDHLIGVIFLEKISNYKKIMTAENYRRQIRNDEKYIQIKDITVKNLTFIDTQ